jgi:hypothetical protein
VGDDVNRLTSGVVARTLAAIAVVSLLSLAAGAPTALAQETPPADEPVPEPAPEPADDVAVGEVDGAIVAVAAPPVPPTTTIVAVGKPPVPPTTVVVAVGKPPVPPTVTPTAQRVVVASSANRPSPAPAISRARVSDAAQIVADGLEQLADLF